MMKKYIVIGLVAFLFFLGCNYTNTNNANSINEINKPVLDYLAADSSYVSIASKTYQLNWDSLPLLKPKKKILPSKIKSKKVFNLTEATNFKADSIRITALIEEEIIPKLSSVDLERPNHFPITRIGNSPKDSPIEFEIKENARQDIQYFGVEEGLEIDYIRNSVLDESGFLWFSTYGGGLLRFDGNQLKNFTSNDGLSSNFINKINKDSNGDLWIMTTDSGFLKYNGQAFFDYQFKKDSNLGFFDFSEKNKNEFWFGSDEGIYVLKDNNTIQKLQLSSAIDNFEVKQILFDDDTTWIASANGLFSLKNNILTKHSLGFTSISSLFLDKDKTLWITDYVSGFAAYKNGWLTHFKDTTNNNNNNCNSIYRDSHGDINVSTANLGVLIYNGINVTSYNTNFGLSGNSILDVTEDLKGNKWLSSFSGGIIRIGNNELEKLPNNDDIISSSITSIANNTLNTDLWLGSTSKNLYQYNNCDTFYELPINNGQEKDYVNNFQFVEDKGFWISSTIHSTISYYDFNTETFTNYTLGSSDNGIYDLQLDNEGVLWGISFDTGLFRFDGNTFKKIDFPKFNDTWTNYLYQIEKDEKGHIIVLSYRHVYIVENNTLKAYPIDKRYITDVAINDDQYWVATYKGPLKLNFNHKKEILNITSYYSVNKISENLINTINISSNNAIVLGTDSKGLKILKENDSTKQTGVYSVSRINKGEGFNGIGVYDGASFLDSNDKAFYGTKRGFTLLSLNTNKNKDTLNEIKPYVSLVKVNNVIMDPFVLKDSISAIKNGVNKRHINAAKTAYKSLNIPQSLTLNNSYNNFIINFSAINWNYTSKIKFRYKLDGLEAKWNPTTTTNFADYKNLPDGNYTFMVQAMNKYDHWSKSFSYKFTILPPWYKTPLAYSIYTLITILLLWMLIKIKSVSENKKRDKKYQEEMVRQIQFEEGRQLEKDRIALELHDSILGNLFGIRMGLGFLDMSSGENQKVSREKFLNELSDLETDIRNITHDLSPHIGISGLAYVNVIEEYLLKFSERNAIVYKYIKASKIDWTKVDNSVKFNLFRVIKEASHNTIKHAKATLFTVKFELKDGYIKLVISDDGIGFKNETTKRGIGMQNISSRVKSINGKVIFRNSKPNGAAIIIHIPTSQK